MNSQLKYPSGQSYSYHLSNFKVKISRSGNGKRVHVSFKEKQSDTYSSFSLPADKSRQLAYAILTACGGDISQPIEFEVDEAAATKSIAA